MKKYKSWAIWPAREELKGLSTNGDGLPYTEDFHETLNQAKSVCDMLVMKGFGGDKKIFPLLTGTTTSITPPRFNTWTSEKPESNGFYWWRKNKDSKLMIVRVDSALTNPEEPEQFDVEFPVLAPYTGWRNLKDIHGEWCGPIPKPMEPST